MGNDICTTTTPPTSLHARPGSPAQVSQTWSPHPCPLRLGDSAQSSGQRSGPDQLNIVKGPRRGHPPSHDLIIIIECSRFFWISSWQCHCDELWQCDTVCNGNGERHTERRRELDQRNVNIEQADLGCDQAFRYRVRPAGGGRRLQRLHSSCIL